MLRALCDERTGLSFARLSSNKSVVSMYNLHFTIICNIYMASVSSGSVEQIMPYH
jgi:hypothetical protein